MVSRRHDDGGVRAERAMMANKAKGSAHNAAGDVKDAVRDAADAAKK